MLRDLLPGFTLTSVPRASRGGGLAVLYRNEFSSKVNSGPSYKSFENLDITLSHGNLSCRIISIYRLPTSSKNGSSFNQFLSDFSDLMERIITYQAKIILAGDFNIHFDLPSNSQTSQFMDILETFDLQQHINGPTHCSGHTLDLLITKRINSDSIISTNVFTDAPSDHSYIISVVYFPSPKRSKVHINTRNIRAIDFTQFKRSLQSLVFVLENDSVDDLVNRYNNNLSTVLDDFASLVNKTVTSRPFCEWYTDELRQTKREVRRLERKYIKTITLFDRGIFRGKCHFYKEQLDSAKTQFYCDKFSNCDDRKLFQMVNNLSMPNVGGTISPESRSKQLLANNFSLFFQEKIKRLHSGLDSSDKINIFNIPSDTCAAVLSEFRLVNVTEVGDLIRRSKQKSCALDPLPTSILKNCLDTLLGHITTIINSSLYQATFPKALKHSMIIPSINRNEFSNYRPIANLPFLSKLIEKVAVVQLDQYLLLNYLYPKMQSGYRRFHSTETSLIDYLMI